MEQLVYLALGWLLGLISSLVVLWVTNYSEAQSAKVGITRELTEVRYRMISISSIYYIEYGDPSVDFFRNYKNIVSQYKGVHDEINFELERRFAQIDLNKITQEEIQQVCEVIRRARGGRRAKTAQNIRIPYLETKLNILHRFSESDQKLLLEIMEQTRNFNQLAEDSRQFLATTFTPGLLEGSFDNLQENLNEAYRNMGTTSEIVAKKISEFLGE